MTTSFGTWVRRRRLALDLTQAELARRVGCAAVTVRKIESDERRPSRLMADRLADALELDGGSVTAFLASARSLRSADRLGDPGKEADFGLHGRLPAPAHPILGREAELGELLDLLAAGGGPARMVTITGPPGVGKTRLVVELAERVERKFGVPCVFVDLSTLEHAADVTARLADAVGTANAGLVDASTLTTHALRRSPTLVVFDNFEHVLDAAGLVASVVESCPEVVCVSTSRVALDLYGEHVVRLAPLTAVDVEPDQQHPAAVRLFLARAAGLGVRITGGADLDAATRICAALDGLPLAIELAARALTRQSVRGLLEDLVEERADLGTVGRGSPERRRSTSGAVAWSARRLGAPAQEVLALASVFPSTFDAGALARLGLDLQQAADALGQLAEHGLLERAERTGPPTGRYRMLAIVRDYGRAQLRAAGRLGALRGAHARATAERALAVSPGIRAWPERATVEALAALDADVRVALGWCFGPGGDPALGRDLVGAILPLWYFRGLVDDCLRWSTRAYESAGPGAGRRRYESAYYLAVSRWAAGDLHGAADPIEEAVACAESAGDAAWLAESLGMSQLFALSAGDLATASRLAPRCLEAADRAGAEWRLLAHLRAARLALLGGDLDAAAHHEAACRDASEQAPSTWGRAMTAGVRGDVAAAHGDLTAALAHYRDAVADLVSIDAAVDAMARLSSAATVLTAGGNHAGAALLFGAVDGWCARLGVPLHPMAAFAHEHRRAETMAALGDRYEAVASIGRRSGTAATDLEALLDRAAGSRAG